MGKILDREKLLILRNRKGWTQSDLAKKVGVKAPDISKYELGTIKSPSLQRLNQFASALGCKPADLLKEEEAGAIEHPASGLPSLRPDLAVLTRQVLNLSDADLALVLGYIQVVVDLTGRQLGKSQDNDA